MKQTTYIMVKPHFANYENIIDLIETAIKDRGLTIIESSYIKYSIKEAQEHYAEHFLGSYENAKPFYKKLENYITSDKAYGMIVSGENAIQSMRELIGILRKKVPVLLGEEPRVTENVLHGSDSEKSAENEIKIFHSLKQSKTRK